MRSERRVRFMRLMVFFDLPVVTAKQRRNYRIFRKKLLKEGFVMMQWSVYSKMVLNNTAAETTIGRLELIKPPEGLIQILKITEKQFANITYIRGAKHEQTELDTTNDLVVL